MKSFQGGRQRSRILRKKMGGGVGRVGEGDNQKSVDCPGSLWHSKPTRASDPLLGRNSAFRLVGTLAYTPEWVQPRQTKLCWSPVLQSEVTCPFEQGPGASKWGYFFAVLVNGCSATPGPHVQGSHPAPSQRFPPWTPRTPLDCSSLHTGYRLQLLSVCGSTINFGCQGNHTAV